MRVCVFSLMTCVFCLILFQFDDLCVVHCRIPAINGMGCVKKGAGAPVCGTGAAAAAAEVDALLSRIPHMEKE